MRTDVAHELGSSPRCSGAGRSGCGVSCRACRRAASAGEVVVPTFEYRAAQQQIRELQRLLGKETLENEILRESVERVTALKGGLARELVAGGQR
jgi:hypothetical protein